MFLAILLACFFVYIQRVELYMADTQLGCNTGCYMYDKTTKEFNVTQEDCLDPLGSCEDCFKQCSNYTDVISKYKGDVDETGKFSVQWSMNGPETLYLMEYGVQTRSGVLEIYYAFLHFSGTDEFPEQEWYRVILKCQTAGFVRVRVTLKLPSGNRTTFNPVTTRSTEEVGKSVSVPLVQKTQSEDSVKRKQPVNTWVIVAILLAGTITIFIASIAYYIRKVVKKKNDYALENNVPQSFNNTGNLAGDQSLDSVQQLQPCSGNNSQNNDVDDTGNYTEHSDCAQVSQQYPATDEIFSNLDTDNVRHHQQKDLSITEGGFSPHIQAQLRRINMEV